MTTTITIAPIVDALGLIHGPGQVAELRALDVSEPSYRRPHTVSGYYDDPARLAADAVKIAQHAKGVYFTPNPVTPGLLARAVNRARAIENRDPTTSDGDVTRRRWFLLDADPVRPAGISSSDAEHDAALARVREMRDALARVGWPDPIVADSGNGGHLLYRVDLPNDEGSRDLVRRCLEALALRFDDAAVSIDRAVFNAARIWKLYGTPARKGEDTSDRPHRLARILDAPAACQPVERGQLEALAAMLPVEPKVNGAYPKGPVERFDLDRWIAQHGLDLSGPKDYHGGRLWTFHECPWNPDHRYRSAYLIQFSNGAIAAGCHHNGCAGKDWHALRDLVEPDRRQRGTRSRSAHVSTPRAGAASVSAPASETESARDTRRWINAGEKDFQVITAEGWQALRERNDPEPWLFRHAGIAARLETDDDGAPVLRDLTPDRLRHELARAAVFYVEKTGEDLNGNLVTRRETKKTPTDVVLDMLASASLPLPVLDRITETPAYAASGALQLAPGYHPETRTYFLPPVGFSLPSLPDRPSEADVARARGLIVDDLLADFPFAGPADRANAVGLFLQSPARDLIRGATPLHLIESPTPGSGKGLLADVLLTPWSGRHVGIVAEARDDDEWRKRLTARLREARSAVLLDNITRPLDSGVLAAALTAPVWEDRLLGKSETIRVPVRCAWIATANNPALSTEIARRTVRIRLDPRVDRPWLRDDFHHANLRAWADERRADLVWAGLVLIRAWLLAGRPAPQVRPLGSYESWSFVIGGILQHAGIPGFLGNLTEFYETADLEGQMWRAFVAAWWEKFADRDVGTSDLFALALSLDDFTLGGASERAQRTIFGRRLGQQRDRVIGDYRIVVAGKVHRANRWRLTLPEKVNVVNVGERYLPVGQKNIEEIYLHGVNNVHQRSPRSPVFDVDSDPDCIRCGQPAEYFENQRPLCARCAGVPAGVEG